MARPKIVIDIRGAQNILDDIKPGQFANEDALCTFAASEYNRVVGTPIIQGQLFKLRIKNEELKLNFPMPRGRRGRAPGEKLSNEHKAKLIAGRSINKNKSNITPSNNRAAVELRLKHTHTRINNDGKEEVYIKYPKLVEGAIRGNKSACIKLHCIDCMGDDKQVRDSIRNCTSFVCPIYSIRPFQK